ncbi:MAG: hypothetical protein II916_10135 [Oscillospiraceae bacterium]|nr:hypothetical protein [Oscillospiraceae bacterium]
MDERCCADTAEKQKITGWGLLYLAMTRIFTGTLRSMTRSMRKSWFFWRNLRRAKPSHWWTQDIGWMHRACV